jgi:general secretion pathway protein J
MKNARGFTLIEVVIAASLLAVGLALVFASIRGAMRATERAEVQAQREERLRAVQGFMRSQITAAMPIAYQFSPETGEAKFFTLSATKLEFVANMPGYLSRGGPYLQTLELVPGEGGQRLLFQHQMLSSEGALPAEREAVVLFDGIAEASFDARTIDPNAKASPWQPRWEASAQLPPMVRLRLRFADGSRRWPEFVAAPRLAVAVAAPLDAIADGR